MPTKPPRKRVLPKLKLTIWNGTLKRKHPLWPEYPVPIAIAFTEDEKPCPFVALNGDGKVGIISRKLSSLYFAKLEMLKCSTILEFTVNLEKIKKSHDKHESDGSLITNSFFDSAVIWYSKVFIDSDDGRVKLDANIIYNKNPEYMSLHKKIIDLRHKLIAHQTKAFEDTIPFVALNPDESKKDIVEIYYRMISPDFSNSHYIALLLNMAKMAAEQITVMICRAEDRLLDELNALGLDYLYTQAFRFGSADQAHDGSVLLLDDEPAGDNFETYIRHHQ